MTKIRTITFLCLILFCTTDLLAQTPVKGGQKSTSAKQVNAGLKPPQSQAPKPIKVVPDWAKSANIYEVNVRQYTPEGTFKAFAKHLPRLKEMGVDIIWLMPIYPISETKRKGSLGSYYAVSDYKGINPEYGNEMDFKKLVDEIHRLDMKIILDWVANHTGWDNPMMQEHPEWYTKNKKGEFQAPVADWSDVADLNFKDEGLQQYMIDALKYWVTEFDIDGYRCDVADMVPVTFWNKARKNLDAVKPVFMLAEAENPEHHKEAFDMSYAWEFHHLMNSIAKGERNAKDLDDYFKKNEERFPDNAYFMNFTSNHDENSWNGTTKERMGDAHKALAVLASTVPGMPLIYSGQETGLDKRLRFFDKDTIEWQQNHEMMEFYTKLLTLKKENPALWNGAEGGQMVKLKIAENDKVSAFVRTKYLADRTNYVMVLINLSNEPQEIIIQNLKQYGFDFKDAFTMEEFDFSGGKKEKKKKKNIPLPQSVKLDAWGYKVLVK